MKRTILFGLILLCCACAKEDPVRVQPGAKTPVSGTYTCFDTSYTRIYTGIPDSLFYIEAYGAERTMNVSYTDTPGNVISFEGKQYKLNDSDTYIYSSRSLGRSISEKIQFHGNELHYRFYSDPGGSIYYREIRGSKN
jgi:hypothetical protein